MTQTNDSQVRFARTSGRAMHHAGRCNHCKQCPRTVEEPCPHCHKRGW